MWHKAESIALIAVIAGVCAPRGASFVFTAAFPARAGNVATDASTTTHPSTALYGRAIKRGALKDVSPGTVTKTSSKKKKKKKNSPSFSTSSSPSNAAAPAAASGNGISSKLSQWAAADASDDDATTSAATIEVDSESSEKEEAGPTRKKKGGAKKASAGTDRKSRQAERRAEETARAILVEDTIDVLLDIFDPLDEEGNSKKKRKVEYDMSYVLDKIQTLIDNPSPNTGLRVLTAGQKLRDYRMVWAGSDDAICHLGTGLHNVPLARLEEIFLTVGKKRVEVIEVIRILGPFPNVRNTLKGDAVMAKSAASRLHIEYDSMIDGTGKQILAGSENNKRALDLDILFADENAIICAIPPEEDEVGGNPLGENGSKVLFFSNEEAMDVKLEMLRVA